MIKLLFYFYAEHVRACPRRDSSISKTLLIVIAESFENCSSALKSCSPLHCVCFIACVAQASAAVSTAGDGEAATHDLFRNEPIVLAVRVRVPREILDHVRTVHAHPEPPHPNHTPICSQLAPNYRKLLLFPTPSLRHFECFNLFISTLPAALRVICCGLLVIKRLSCLQATLLFRSAEWRAREARVGLCHVGYANGQVKDKHCTARARIRICFRWDHICTNYCSLTQFV